MQFRVVGFAFLGLAAGLILWLAWQFALVVPKQEIATRLQVSHYDVDGRTLQEIRDQLRARGPAGFAARTDWQITTGLTCRVTLETQIRLPRHTDVASLARALKGRWLSFERSLRLHEHTHQFHGLSAARDIAKHRCFGTGRIIADWAQQDRLLDESTGHGWSEGVRF
ncbi:DUF922 domain-containing protein [Shimia sediminis]|uniref:DUF922 domain-containing protein n=1 Tax=Shimia sediminis TaxID=2497945 RepID=UPI0013DECACA|nr:DUF922 domain-containing protein [Shimia sediminis]